MEPYLYALSMTPMGLFFNRIKAFLFNPLKVAFLFVSNGFLIWVFLRALIDPGMYAAWIYNNAILIFILEFFSIHASAMSDGIATEKTKKRYIFIILLAYAIFVVLLGFAFRSWFPPLYFLISTFIKFMEARKFSLKNTQISLKDSNRIVFNALIFLSVLFAIVALAPLLNIIFPFPASILEAKPAGVSGLFANTPQTVLVWGLVYFSLHFIINSVQFLRMVWQEFQPNEDFGS